MFTGEYVLLHGGLVTATAMEVDEKATTNLSAALSARTTMARRWQRQQH
jgi:hypothetical protein